MKASELIRELNLLVNKHGDLEVVDHGDEGIYKVYMIQVPIVPPLSGRIDEYRRVFTFGYN